MSSPLDDLQAIDVRAMAAYLTLHGWERVREGELGDRWQKRHDHRTRNIAIPTPSLGGSDRALMLSNALRVLEEIEQRSSDLVARDLRDGDSDIVRFRVSAPGVESGEIPALAAPEMLRGALEALQSAGRAEVRRRPFYGGGRLPAQVSAFLSDARVTPAEKGSVVLVIRSKVDPSALAQGSFFREDERPSAHVPFERRALHRLIRGVDAAKSAAHTDASTLRSPEAFDDAIEDGLSANLCDALTHLAGIESKLDGTVTVSVRWSLTIPSDEPEAHVALLQNELKSLSIVADSLRAITPLKNRSLKGHVRDLNRDPGRRDGTVRVVVDLEGRAAIVKLHLAFTDYQMALRAHEQNLQLAFTGTLDKAGKIWEVTQPREIKLAH